MADFTSWLRGWFGGKVKSTSDPGSLHPDSGPSLLQVLVNSGGLKSSALVKSEFALSKYTQLLLKPFARQGNEFAFAIYRQLQPRPGNLFFSPFSIRTALGMVCAGARGETATRMREALVFPPDEETAHNASAEITAWLEASGGEYEMAVANALWGQEGVALQAEFLDLIARQYGGAMHGLDFRHAAEVARQAINRWVDDKTRGKIRDLIPPDGLSDQTRLVIADAVYFKGAWVEKFPKDLTHDEPFHLEDGTVARTPLMCRKARFPYLQAEGYQAVDLPYRGGKLSMLVLLPDRMDGLRDLEKALSGQALDGCVAQLRIREIELFLPRFELTWGSVDLSDELRALGMQIAFDPAGADLSGINGRRLPDPEALSISAVFHKAYAKVDEEGTEATAATAEDVFLGISPDEPVFRADHPFLFAIRDVISGAILFLGRIEDPTRRG